MVAAKPNESSSSGTGGAERQHTGLDESAMTTKRSAAAATIFSRVWAAPPPFTSHPSGEIWSAPSMAMSKPVDAVEGLDSEHPTPRAASSVRGEVATQRMSSDRRARAGRGGHRRTGAEPHGHGVLDQLCGGLGGELLLPLDAHGVAAQGSGRGHNE